MPNYKVVDAEQLDSDLASVADSIRTKGGTSGKLAFPSGFKSAVEAISTGIEVQRVQGSVDLNSSKDEYTIDIGFKPDIVYLYDISELYQGAGMCYSEEVTSFIFNSITYASSVYINYVNNATQSVSSVYIYSNRNDNGFNLKFAKPSTASATIAYVAIKYTE